MSTAGHTTCRDNALQAKFKNVTEQEMLLETGDAYLEETNYWKDTYWGKCNGVGLNNLGEMLMKIRDNLRINHE